MTDEEDHALRLLEYYIAPSVSWYTEPTHQLPPTPDPSGKRRGFERLLKPGELLFFDGEMPIVITSISAPSRRLR